MIKAVLLIIFAVAIVVFAPFASIWALNTLFPALNIAYTFDTWLAALLLSGALGGSSVRFRK